MDYLWGRERDYGWMSVRSDIAVCIHINAVNIYTHIYTVYATVDTVNLYGRTHHQTPIYQQCMSGYVQDHKSIGTQGRSQACHDFQKL